MFILPTPNVRRALRAGAGVTLEELAKRVGVAITTAHYWEQGAEPRSLSHRASYSALRRSWALELTSGIDALVRDEGTSR